MFYKRKKSYLLCFVMIIVCMLSGCQENSPICLYDEIITMEDERVQDEKEYTQIGVYVDSTPSMEGYIGWHSDESEYQNIYPEATKKEEELYKEYVSMTIYNQSLDVMNTIISSNFDAEAIYYYSINTTLWKTTTNVLESAQSYSFYGDSNNKDMYDFVEEYKDNYSSSYDNPSISYAIENALKDDFAIIVTDLYENEGNADVLINNLKQIGKEGIEEKSIGIIGVPSEFAGVIYDLPDGSTMEYGVDESIMGDGFTREDIQFRPFYILLIGDLSQINVFIEQFETSMNNLEIQKMVWNNENIYGVDYRDYVKLSMDNHYARLQSEILIQNTINKEKLSQEVVELQKSELEEVETLYLIYDISTNTLKNYLSGQGDVETVEICIDEENISAVKLNNLKIDSVCLSQFEDESAKKTVADKIQKAVEVKGIYWMKEEQQLAVELDLHKNKISSGIYVLQLDVSNIVDDTFPQWIEEWTLPVNEKNGRKTQNLNMICKAIDTVFSAEEQNILNMQFYFRIRR